MTEELCAIPTRDHNWVHMDSFTEQCSYCGAVRAILGGCHAD